MSKERHHGLILEPIVIGDHWLAGTERSIAGERLQPDRDWRPYRPSKVEIQNLNGIEPSACTNFAIHNAIEMVAKKKWGIDLDLSDRYFAKASGTRAGAGNGLHTVCEYWRHNGVVYETDWPFDATITTVDKFYATLPSYLYPKARKILGRFSFSHDWVTTSANELYDKLQDSPLAFSVYAWVKDDQGYYYRPQGKEDTHLTVCVYAEKGKYWEVLDSYKDGNVILKKVRWDSLPMQAKRISLTLPSTTDQLVWYVLVLHKLTSFFNAWWQRMYGLWR